MIAPADAIAHLLARAAEGDQQAAAGFWELRSLRTHAADRFRDSGRRHAHRMIRRSTDEETP